MRSRVYPGGKGSGNSESLVYIRDCKIANDTKFLELSCYLSMRYFRTEFSKLYLSDFDVCVTVRHWYNNIKSQLDATIVILLKIFNQLNIFWGDDFTEPQEH